MQAIYKMEAMQSAKEGRKTDGKKKSTRDAPSPRDLRTRFPPTVVTHDLPGSLHADVLQIVVAAFLVLFQRTALLVAPAAVVALVRLPHCGKNESFGSNPRQPTFAIDMASSQQTHSRDGKTPQKGYSSPRPSFQPRFPTTHTSSHPPGTWPHQFFTLTPSIGRSLKRRTRWSQSKQTDCKRGKQTKQLNHTPALPVCHQASWE